MQPSLELSLSWSPEAFLPGNYIYIWLDGQMNPFYVGETSKSPSDRIGLHIRDKSRSGAIVAAIMASRRMPMQIYTVLAFAVPDVILEKIAEENGASFNETTANRARKALEFQVGAELATEHIGLHRLRGARWKATTANDFVSSVMAACRAKRDA